jgi:hypothetical protein
LRKLGIADNTMVWFSSDNGGWPNEADPANGSSNGPLRGRKTIVFTEFRDTALAIARHLRHRTRVLCVAGDGAWAGTERLPRRVALDAFAPRARAARPDRLLEADVLVATDVASEGMNLQDASAVVNYDLPWNPVRVMQRIGRIDRLNSAHPSVALAHLVPGHGMHDLAGVLRPGSTTAAFIDYPDGATVDAALVTSYVQEAVARHERG